MMIAQRSTLMMSSLLWECKRTRIDLMGFFDFLLKLCFLTFPFFLISKDILSLSQVFFFSGKNHQRHLKLYFAAFYWLIVFSWLFKWEKFLVFFVRSWNGEKLPRWRNFKVKITFLETNLKNFDIISCPWNFVTIDNDAYKVGMLLK